MEAAKERTSAQGAVGCTDALRSLLRLVKCSPIPELMLSP